MSGVNAHLLLKASAKLLAAEHVVRLHWQRSRLYALPRQFNMCSSFVRSSKRQARFCCPTAVARLSSLWDATAAGQSVLSTTAAMECAASAMRQCHEEGRFCLSNVLLNISLTFPDTIYTNVDLGSGSVHLESEQSVAILSCYIEASPSSASALQQASRGSYSSLLHTLPLAKHDSAYGHSAVSHDSGAYVLHPGHSLAALQLSTLHASHKGVVSGVQRISVPDKQPQLRQDSAVFSIDRSAALSSSNCHFAAFKEITTTLAPGIADIKRPATDVLFTVDWLVDNVQAACAVSQGTLVLLTALSGQHNKSYLHASKRLT